jgi:hypothetical protein
MSDSLLNDRRCPVCGAANECRIANGCLYKGPCWCEAASVPAVVQRYFADLGLEAACLCRTCLGHLAKCATGNDSADAILARVRADKARASLSADSYLDENGRTVFAAAFHLKRGYCCGNGCRHCPYNPHEPRAEHS